MPASLFDWSTTPGSNTSVNGVNIAEGMSPALVNDAMRSMMALIKQTFHPALQSFYYGGTYLPIPNGGTNAGDAPTALANLGGLSVAYRDLPSGNNQSAAFTFSDAMRGGGVEYTGAAATGTINQNATTAIGVRGVIVVRNNGSGALTIAPAGTAALRKNGATSSSSAVLGIGGVATLIQWNIDDWTITGSNIS